MNGIKSGRVYAQVVDENVEDGIKSPMSSDGYMTEMSIDDDDRAEGVYDSHCKAPHKRITSRVLDYDDEGLG